MRRFRILMGGFRGYVLFFSREWDCLSASGRVLPLCVDQAARQKLSYRVQYVRIVYGGRDNTELLCDKLEFVQWIEGFLILLFIFPVGGRDPFWFGRCSGAKSPEIKISSDVFLLFPCLPLYYVRIHASYEWNKHNRYLYFFDNMPSKTITGYKFNIFYTGFFSENQFPRFFLEQLTETSDARCCILRFSLGPPLSDCSFKVLNRVWDVSQRKGFRSVFDQGIYHLYFNFRRLHYRR